MHSISFSILYCSTQFLAYLLSLLLYLYLYLYSYYFLI
uniref:Uncharacterized protein n=1 Tax=Acinetobacter phage vB_Ab_1137_KEN_05 TaxID=3143020 RepID=A0AAU8KZ92_9VIRU